MNKEKVRVLRILEYVGDREWVEDTLRKSSVPLNGDSSQHTGKENVIKSAVIDGFPEILDNNDSSIELDLLKVNDRVVICDDYGKATHLGTIVNINDFREPSQKYAVDVDGYDDDVLFFGIDKLRMIK